MTNSRYQYDSREEIGVRGMAAYHRAEPPEIGVLASVPYWHHGLGAQYVEIHCETAFVSSATYGDTVPAHLVQDKVCEMLGQAADDLTAVINHLTEHRDRMLREMRDQRARTDWIKDNPLAGPADTPVRRTRRPTR